MLLIVVFKYSFRVTDALEVRTKYTNIAIKLVNNNQCSPKGYLYFSVFRLVLFYHARLDWY
jgi:hypothetical protein